jgi:hypothetical protein
MIQPIIDSIHIFWSNGNHKDNIGGHIMLTSVVAKYENGRL